MTLFNTDKGVLYKWSDQSFNQFGWNLLGAFVITIWSAFWGFLIFGLLRISGLLRVPRHIELKGILSEKCRHKIK